MVIGYQFSVIGYQSTENRKPQIIKSLNFKYQMENYKKLQRNTRNKVLGGVCSGLADYFGIDAALVRVLFVVILLCGGTGLLIYCILWIAMPANRDDQPQQFANQAAETPKSSKGSLIAGLTLIVLGLLFLLGNLIPQFNWETYWPVLLIALGLLLIVPLSNKTRQ